MTLDPYANTSDFVSDEQEWKSAAPIEKMGGSARIEGRSRSLLWPRVYDALKDKGYDSSKAAAISNAHWNKYRRWGKAGSPGPKSMADRKAALAKGWEPGEDWSEGWDSFLSDTDIAEIADELASRFIIKYSPSQPRDDHGRWTRGGGMHVSRSFRVIDGEGKGSGEHHSETGGGIRLAFGGGDGTKEHPYHTHDVDQAAKWLAEDKYVELHQPDEVATLIEKLQALVADAKAKGAKAPNYDLCKVSVPHTNLFCAGNKGISRSQMPQLSGKPLPGTEADKMPKDDKGEVNLGPAFVQHLADMGIKVKEERMLASHLRASQREINGGKVAGMVGAMEAGKMKEGSIFVTRDGYVVDGHHRWAATVGTSLLKEHDLDMPVKVIDTDIIKALKLANEFSIRMGIPQASVSKSRVKEWFVKGLKLGAGGKQQNYDDNSGRYSAGTTMYRSIQAPLGGHVLDAEAQLRADITSHPEGIGQWFGSHNEARQYGGPGSMVVGVRFNNDDIKRGTQVSPTAISMVDGVTGKVVSTEIHNGEGWQEVKTPEHFLVNTASRMQAPTHETSIDSALSSQGINLDLPSKGPDEPDFAYQSRVLNSLPPEVKHEVLARVRERTRIVPFIANAENEFRAEHHLPNPQCDWDSVKADWGKAQRIVATLDSMKRDPHNPKYKAAYDDFKRQNEEMWDLLTNKLHVKVEKWDERKMGANDPYETAEEQALDLQNNRHLWINRGEFFIGSNPDSPTGTDHPFMTGDEYFRFRAVHDAFGHAGIGSGFDRHGEYAAWMAHNSMYTGEGRKAMSTEYHGVNSYLWASGGKPLPKEHWGVIMPDDLIANVFDDQGHVVRKWYSDTVDDLIKQLGITAETATKLDNNYELSGSVHTMGYVNPSVRKSTKVGAGGKQQEFDGGSGRYMSAAAVKDMLDSQGGFTVDPRNGKQPKEGFAVAVQEENSLIMHDDSFSDAEVDSWMKQHIDQPSFHVGGWHDKENGKYVLDVVHVEPDQEKAIQLAQEHDQVAIYDLKQGKEIQTGGTGGYKAA
jgi:hypothetical protein